MQQNIKIGIIGLGMVGMPLMKWFVNNGWQRSKDLFCYDSDPKKGYFDDILKAKIIFICVPTPPNPDGSCNTSIVESVIAKFGKKGKILIIKSTVPPEFTSSLSKKYKCSILFNPEFLTEAQAWEDFIKPDRQIVAHSDNYGKRFATTVLSLLPIAFLQSPGVHGTYKFHEANSTEAEMSKYGGNCFGAMKVTFFNILADFCGVLDVDYENTRRLITHDRRIGASWTDVLHGNYRGFGGFCFPKDLNAFISFAEQLIKTKKKNKKVLVKGIEVLKSIRDYNRVLLESQGLTEKDVSIHSEEVQKKLENKK